MQNVIFEQHINIVVQQRAKTEIAQGFGKLDSNQYFWFFKVWQWIADPNEHHDQTVV